MADTQPARNFGFLLLRNFHEGAKDGGDAVAALHGRQRCSGGGDIVENVAGGRRQIAARNFRYFMVGEPLSHLKEGLLQKPKGIVLGIRKGFLITLNRIRLIENQDIVGLRQHGSGRRRGRRGDRRAGVSELAASEHDH
ncbi:MAG: hypothetical protein KIT00_10265 [Rhodospirillales bacterium]|nr:hypothetical protein [Rhodospirillales bacterium]